MKILELIFYSELLGLACNTYSFNDNKLRMKKHGMWYTYNGTLNMGLDTKQILIHENVSMEIEINSDIMVTQIIIIKSK